MDNCLIDEQRVRIKEIVSRTTRQIGTKIEINSHNEIIGEQFHQTMFATSGSRKSILRLELLES